MQTRHQFRHVNELTGLFVLAVLGLVLAGVIFSGYSQRWFARKYTFDVALPEAGASGLRRGNEVFVLGVSAGLVDDITVDDNGRMMARVKIRPDFERFVRADSTASIKKVFGVAGDSLIEISRGTGAALSSGKPQIICLVSEDSLDRMERLVTDFRAELMPVVKKAGPALDEWTKLGANLQTNTLQLQQFITRIDHLAAGVEQGKGTVGKLLNETTLTDDAQELLTRATQTMNELRSVVTNLDSAVKNVQNGTVRLPEITQAIANEAKDLPGLIQQTQTSMRELERLIEATQRHWLVRKYVNKTNPPPLGAPLATEQVTHRNFNSLNTPKSSN